MRFRPCIDIHNGKVKQIVGGSLRDTGDVARENFVSGQDSAFYAKLYRKRQLTGGHVIMLNGGDSPYYEETKQQALAALSAYPGGLQVGGGITAENGSFFLEAGASHVIVTSYVFREGRIDEERLKKLKKALGRERLVLDISCRKKEDGYYIVTDRWQTFTRTKVTAETMDALCGYCSEFLVHGVDVEGKASGIEKDLVKILGDWGKCPVTYAGGIAGFEDLEELYRIGKGRLDFTVGSALDLFGGSLDFEKISAWNR